VEPFLGQKVDYSPIVDTSRPVVPQQPIFILSLHRKINVVKHWTTADPVAPQPSPSKGCNLYRVFLIYNIKG
jgi:hypothetical protein